jgi:DNA mismatch repair protein MutS2
MSPPFRPGDSVQTPLGKGVVREVRNNGDLAVGVKDRVFVVAADEVTGISEGRGRSRRDRAVEDQPEFSRAGGQPGGTTTTGVDLHGLTVEEALARVEQALNDALLADVPELRLIHGRSGGRIRTALHRRLGEIKTVRDFVIDPGNEGVTIVSL